MTPMNALSPLTASPSSAPSPPEGPGVSAARSEVSRASAREVVEDWLADLIAATTSSDHRRAGGLFVPDGHWRDLLAFTGDLRSFSGTTEIEEAFERSTRTRSAAHVQICQSTPPQHTKLLETPTIEAIFTFQTAVGRGRGHVRLVAPNDGGRARAWTLLTYLTELTGYEESRADHLLRGATAVRAFGEKNWLDLRQDSRQAAQREPTVLIVGGGQNGLALAARLNQLNVDNLVVDPMERVGDNWRNRYHALVLHNETPANHLPYMPFPENWPTYLSKDQVGNWLEAYAEALEVNVATETWFVGAAYDDERDRWEATLRTAGGAARVLHPRHVVMATGVSGIPHIPDIPGLGSFAGEVIHSSKYSDGALYRDRRAIVLGTGNSAHDVAQDLHGHGAKVTMVQRGSTTVVSVDPSARLNAELYMSGLPLEDADTIAASIPYPLLVRTNQAMTKRSKELDEALLAGLESVGFRTDWGEDDTGWVMKYRRKHGGYYLNVGCSDLIVNRQIELLQYDEVDTVVPQGVLMRDGSVRDAELLILGTGYKGQQLQVAELFGDEIADRVGPIWGLDGEGELRNVWRKTGQRRLWFMAGSLLQCRFYSRVLALQIKADEEHVGLV